MATLVEFFGIPASGKSTVRDLLRAELEGDGVVVVDGLAALRGERRSRLRTLAGRSAAGLRHRRIVVWAARQMMASDRRWRERIVALRLVLLTLEAGDRARRDPSDRVHLLDEGLIQRAFLLHVDARETRPMPRVGPLVPGAPVGDVLVFVDTPVPEALHRVARRDRGVPPRFDGLDQLDLLDRFGEGRNLLADLAARATRGLGSARPAPVLRHVCADANVAVRAVSPI